MRGYGATGVFLAVLCAAASVEGGITIVSVMRSTRAGAYAVRNGGFPAFTSSIASQQQAGPGSGAWTSAYNVASDVFYNGALGGSPGFTGEFAHASVSQVSSVSATSITSAASVGWSAGPNIGAATLIDLAVESVLDVRFRVDVDTPVMLTASVVGSPNFPFASTTNYFQPDTKKKSLAVLAKSFDGVSDPDLTIPKYGNESPDSPDFFLSFFGPYPTFPNSQVTLTPGLYRLFSYTGASGGSGFVNPPLSLAWSASVGLTVIPSPASTVAVAGLGLLVARRRRR